MIIAEIKNYIKEHPGASFNELQKYSGLDIKPLRKILDVWVSKGKLERFMPDNPCGDGTCGCSSCVVLALEFYTWKQ